MNRQNPAKTRPPIAHLALSGLALAAALGAAPAWGLDEPAATPYRPTVSNPAELSAPGWLEIEAGVSTMRGGGARRQSNSPWLLKLGITEDFGVLLGGDLYARQSGFDGTRLDGGGDTSLTFKHRWEIDESAALGLEWGSKFATAARNLGSGEQDYSINGIYSQDLGAYRLDLNLGATQLGLAEAGLSRWQSQWAMAVSRPISEKWSLAVETAAVHRRGTSPSAQFLAAASYSLSPRLVLDFGLSSGLSRTAPDWSAFFGMTYLAGKLW